MDTLWLVKSCTFKNELIEETLMSEEFNFKTWKTIELGTDDDFCKALKEKGHTVSDFMKEIFSHNFTSGTNRRVNLVSVSVA